jgi:two-component system chemotaxis response regulator CheY
MAHKEKVLIVDDVAVMRDLLKSMLIAHGYENVDFASSGEEAIKRVQQQRYPIITLDINMPGISGLKTLQEIKALDADSFVVMVSSHSSAENVKQAIACGVDGFIAKPYNNKKVSEFLEKYRKLNTASEEV